MTTPNDPAASLPAEPVAAAEPVAPATSADATAVVPPVRDPSALAAAPTPIWKPIAFGLLFLAIALVANSGGLRGGVFLWTDRPLVSENFLLASLGGLQRIWAGLFSPSTFDLAQYSPLSQTTFFVDRLIWGDHVSGYRLTSCLLHALTALMLWHLLRRLAVPGAIVVALLFVAHPLTVESVSLLSERRIVLAALLGLAGLFVVLRGANAIERVEGARADALPNEPERLYALGGALWALALFAHAAIAPIAAVALLIVWWKRRPFTLPLAGACVAMIAAGMAIFVVNARIEQAHADAPQGGFDLVPAGEGGDLVARAQLAGRSVGFYVQKLLVPFPLMNDYPRWQTPGDLARGVEFAASPEERARFENAKPAIGPGRPIAWVWPVAVVALSVAAIAVAARYGNRGAIVCLAAFLLMLFPFLGFVDLGWMWNAFVADHAAYFASVPFLVGIVALLAPVLGGEQQRASLIATVGVVVVTYTLLAANTSRRYTDDVTFWMANAHVSKGNPNSPLALMGFSDAAQGGNAPDYGRAARALEKARTIRPGDPLVHLKIGRLYATIGDNQQAMGKYKFVMDRFPEDARPYVAAGDLFSREADRKPTDPNLRGEAFRLYKQATTLAPRDANAQIRYGETAYEIIRRLPDRHPEIPALINEAATAFNEAVQVEPYNVDHLLRMSAVLLPLGRYEDTSKLLKTAITLAPRRADALELVGDAAIAAGDARGAESAIRESIKLDPERPSPYVKLGTLLNATGRFGDAIEVLEKAVELQPANADAKAQLEKARSSGSTTQPTAATVPAAATTRVSP